MSCLTIPRKIWRSVVKKKRRARRRQAIAHQRRSEPIAHTATAVCPQTVIQNSSDSLDTAAAQLAQELNAEQNRLWLAYDQICVDKWMARQAELQHVECAKRAQRERIQAEFEARERRLETERLDRVRRADEKQRQYELLQQRIEEFLHDDRCPMPEELRTGCTETQPGREACRMFARTGACRFGDDKCAHNHRRARVSKVLLVPHLFVLAVAAEKRAADEEKEYANFFWDILPEVHEMGAVTQFRVCRNRAPHLAGNLLMEFDSER